MTFRGIIDLVTMKAEIYYDDLGKDIREEEIPEDMRSWRRSTTPSCWSMSPSRTTSS